MDPGLRPLPSKMQDFLAEYNKPEYGGLRHTTRLVWCALPQFARDGFNQHFMAFYFKCSWLIPLLAPDIDPKARAAILHWMWSQVRNHQDDDSARWAQDIQQEYECRRRVLLADGSLVLDCFRNLY
jgi:hypothetical protein